MKYLKSYGYDYVNRIGYDKFEQRTYLKYCNGAETFYTYDPQRRRLQNLTVNSGGNTIMDNAYTYDAVSNVLSVVISYIHAEGYPAAEMKHGPIALVDTDMPIVFLATHHQLYEKIISNMQEVKSRNGRILAIVTEGDKQVKAIADSVIEVPQTLNALVPLLSVVPLQILAYYVALYKGLNVDMPRNLAKSVTVE